MATFSTPIIVYVPNDPGVTPAERIAFMQAMGCAIDTEVPHKNTGTSETISRIWSFDQLPYLNSAASSNNHPVRKVEFDDLADLVNEVQLDSALDAEVVHLDGLELIEGEKVFVALPTLHVTSLTPTGRQLISATVCDAQIAAGITAACAGGGTIDNAIDAATYIDHGTFEEANLAGVTGASITAFGNLSFQTFLKRRFVQGYIQLTVSGSPTAIVITFQNLGWPKQNTGTLNCFFKDSTNDYLYPAPTVLIGNPINETMGFYIRMFTGGSFSNVPITLYVNGSFEID